MRAQHSANARITPMIDWKLNGDVGLLRMAHGKANVLDVEFCRALADALETAENSAARAVVLAGQGSIFSGGVDLHRLVQGGPDYIKVFLPALDALLARAFTFEKPLIGAINGHAIAGGALLALCCDRLVLARGGARIGVPELKVGVPIPALGIEILRTMLVEPHLSSAIYHGKLWQGEECLAAGLVHEVVEADRLEARCLELAQELGAAPTASFALTKGILRLPALDALDKHGARVREENLRVWSAPETLRAVEGYIAKTLKKA